ncbi:MULTISPECIES: glucose 1-dehydrogenase [Streptomyces]|uniref:glucose 1-dehydrogenase n=1 Tax=Streptomyces TaxID=1883 RepID=UPI00089555ED|nr:MULTISPECIES: glucose 1-dehydrogenase [unclassified Streptomyces]SEB85776.1 NAD(P)-dependent dehydrogenase, short-chain alcohol dehydrogenase family [Streptomyces sp. PAN_FS17]SEE03850.1 NAD(P)-dependent dehydrogenase, short-chain alcohol dehydrogenase family [Streptomyces sp. KS_5]
MTDPYFDFTGKVVLVTGGATGIGRAVSLAFARQGAIVVIGDIDERSSETVNLIEKEGGRGLFVPTDVTLARDVARLVATTIDTFGDLHIAFNNAGVFVPPAPLAEQSEEDFDKAIAVDLKGVFLSLKYEIAHMASAGGGAIINTASIAGLIGDPDMAPYVAAKHGVIGLTKAAAVDYAKAGIRVNALAPGLTRTAMTQAWLDDPVKREIVMAGPQLGRAADPEEIVGMVLYLASPAASFTTGGVFVVDGGQTAH